MKSEPRPPILPPELEHLIFISAVRNDLDNVVNYLLVAKYVRDWVLSAIFEVVVLHSRRTYPKGITADLLKRYGHHTRHLLLSNWVGSLTVAENIALCPNIENMALWTGTYSAESIKSLAGLPLKRLSVDISQLSDGNLLTPELKTTFSHITHLDLANAVSSWSQCEPLIYFSSLTHLAIYFTSEVELIKTILEKIPTLEVVIWLSGVFSGMAESVDGVPEEIGDVRVVAVECSYVVDWENGARGEEDMWLFAERIVRSRQAKLRRE